MMVNLSVFGQSHIMVFVHILDPKTPFLRKHNVVSL